MSLTESDGTLLALDWGAAKIGFATADGAGRAVTPRGTIRRQDPPGAWKSGRHDVAALRELVKTFEISGILLGCPQLPGGGDSSHADEARNLAARLEKELAVKVVLRNEALTSWEARSRGAGDDDDAQAAAILLEDYFFERARKLDGKRGSGKVLGLLVLALGAVALGLAGLKYRAFYLQPLTEHLAPALRSGDNAAKSALLVDVRPGMTFSQLGRVLRERGLEIDELSFQFWRRTEGRSYVLKPGEYRILKDASLARAFRDIGSGAQILHKLTVKEGYNLWDIENEFKQAFGPRLVQEASLEALVLGSEPDLENPEAKKVGETFWKLAVERKLMDAVGVKTAEPARRTLEGFLFPETYSFRKYESPRIVVQAMLEQFKARALPILESHPSWGSTPEGRYRLLTLASIVEKESGVASEQPVIASVFWNRLQKKMKLQSDPTTIYGLLPDFDGNLKKSHLVTPSAFNTYTLRELPAGPIANPGETALRAVVNPAFTDYLFFVAKGNGEHVFSSDYKTHSAYVDSYQRRRGTIADPAAPKATGKTATQKPEPKKPSAKAKSQSRPAPAGRKPQR